ncbi:hypothetical protein LCGC14_2685350, partial [marine sediment metagenome]
LDLVKTILMDGVHKPNRTGVDTLSYFCYPFRHDLKDGFPLLTTKKMSDSLWNSMIHELFWFISGENHVRNLKKHTKIWNAWADEKGNLETAYGFYWRNFPHTGGEMKQYDHVKGPINAGNFDQLGYCIEQLKTNPNNRRLVVSAWEPYNAHKSRLPPCHLLYIFNVQNGRLCLHLTQRSCDVGLGICFNIASYALLTHIIAKEVGLKPGILSIMFVDAHIYYAEENDNTLIHDVPRYKYDHSRVLKEQIKRKPYPLPQIKVHGGPWDQHNFEDFELIDYQSHGPLKMKVAV